MLLDHIDSAVLHVYYFQLLGSMLHDFDHTKLGSGEKRGSGFWLFFFVGIFPL